MIVYGWNTFKLDSKKPSELGLPAEMDGQFTLVRRQKYFHLFWIPFFGIGKQWVIKKPNDKNFYEPTIELNTYLYKLDLKHKTPWYTYSLPLLLLAGGLLYVIGDTISSYQSKQRYKKQMAQELKEFTQLVNEGTPYTYYRGYDNNYKYITLKTIASDPQHITVLVSDAQESSDDYEARYPQQFRTHASEVDTLTISKEKFLKAFNPNDGSEYHGIKLNSKYDNFRLSEFMIDTKPYFKKTAATYRNGTYAATLHNVGEEVEIIKLVTNTSEENNLQLDTTAIDKISMVGVPLNLQGSFTGADPVYTGFLIYKSKLNKIDTVDISIRGLSTYISNRKK
ncbi:MAG: hypothetical protein U0U66_12615 [Cytophagaceae bacterium]